MTIGSKFVTDDVDSWDAAKCFHVAASWTSVLIDQNSQWLLYQDAEPFLALEVQQWMDHVCEKQYVFTYWYPYAYYLIFEHKQDAEAFVLAWT